MIYQPTHYLRFSEWMESALLHWWAQGPGYQTVQERLGLK